MIFLAELVDELGLHYVAVLHTIQSASAVFSRADCSSPPRGKRGVHSNRTAGCVAAKQNKVNLIRSNKTRCKCRGPKARHARRRIT
jgi:hypothetical protein